MTQHLDIAPATPVQPAPDHDSRPPLPGHNPWRPLTRIAFRFAVAYFALFLLTESRLGFPLLGVLGESVPPAALTAQYHTVAPIVTLVAGWLGLDATLVEPVASGDQVFFWVLALIWLVVSAVATAVWSVLESSRTAYRSAFHWFYLVVRFVLAAQMFSFGFAKVFPVQMSLALSRLVEPFGQFSPMNVLWNQVGSSPTYEVLLGCAEVTAGLLLVIPRTAMFGALLAAVELTQVFILNATFEVPLLIFTFHLWLLAMALIAPHAQRTARFLTSATAVGRPARLQPFTSRRGIAIALAVQLVVGLWLAGSQVHREHTLWSMIGPDGPKPPLYGIWNVDRFVMDGTTRQPVTDDPERWQRLIVDTTHSYQLEPVSVQRMDGTIADFTAGFDPARATLALRAAADPRSTAQLTYQTSGNGLTLDGSIDGHLVHVELTSVDLATFSTVSRGVQWVQDGPAQPRLHPAAGK